MARYHPKAGSDTNYLECRLAVRLLGLGKCQDQPLVRSATASPHPAFGAAMGDYQREGVQRFGVGFSVQRQMCQTAFAQIACLSPSAYGNVTAIADEGKVSRQLSQEVIEVMPFLLVQFV